MVYFNAYFVENVQKEMYLLPFSNNYRDHDFTLIVDTIEEYFPVDKPRRLTSKSVRSFPRFKKIDKIYDEEFHDQDAYRAKWGELMSNVKKAFKTKVDGYPDLSGAGFFGEVIIEEDEKPDFIRQKILKFYVSILGPFFAIHGVDSSIALLPYESEGSTTSQGNFLATHVITISPVFEYQEPFLKLEDELRSFFPGYMFVPYKIGMSTITNISVADELRDPRSLDTIYEALFGMGAVYDCPTRGDQEYGMGDWTKPLSKKEKSLLDVLSQHVIDAPKGITVHKVWKLQESKQLDTFEISGNVMFGMDSFDIIDLTDRAKAIFISNVRGAPSICEYKIKDNVITLNPSLSFRIVHNSEDTLTLNMILKIKNIGTSIEGEVFEMKFVQMKKLE